MESEQSALDAAVGHVPGNDGCQLSDEAAERLSCLHEQMATRVSAWYVWDWVLTPAEQEALGGDFDTAFNANQGTVGMLARLWSCGPGEAIVQLYERLGSVPAPELARLRRELGLLASVPRELDAKPEWDAATGELLFEGRLVRTVRGGSVARNLRLVLEAFQNADWPRHIADPLSSIPDSQRVREAIRTLNRGLKLIKFAMDGSGQGLIWRRQETSRAPHAHLP